MILTNLGHGDKVGDVGLAGGGRAPVDLQVPRLEDLLDLVLAQGLLQVAGDEPLFLGRAELVLGWHHHDGGQQAAQASLNLLEGLELCGPEKKGGWRLRQMELDPEWSILDSEFGNDSV